MRMPDELRQAIAEETERISRAELVRATAELTEHYRLGNAGSPVKTAAHRAAYLAVRFPATLAAAENVFAELHRLAPEVVIGSILDLGAGPGTAMLAAAQVFPSLREATLVEADPGFIEMGKRLLRAAQPAECKALDARWVQHDLRSGLQVPAHDVVVISYAIGELAQSTAQTVLAHAWKLARQFLVVLEPGTPRGFGIVHAARSLLIAERGFILAPCPHQQACPMSAAGDWCHFSQRVERTSSHRVLKGGTLGHEDEKFSYVIASREELPAASARIVRHPKKLSRHVLLTLCTTGGIKVLPVTKKQREDYRQARRAHWGDSWIDTDSDQPEDDG